MRKLTYSLGALALAAAAIFVWSHSVLVSPEASIASTVGLNPRTTVLAAPSDPISPSEIMVERRNALPVEQWDPF